MMEGREPPRPPVLPRLVMRWLLDRGERRVVQSELSELWRARLERDGVESADRWYRRQWWRYPFHLVVERVRRSAHRGERREAGNEGDVLWSGLMSDVRQSLRGWRRAPLLAGTIVATVGLGIGATASMLTVVGRVLLAPLPYAEPDRLVRVYHAVRGNRWPLSVVDYQAIVEQQTVFEAVAAYATSSSTFSDGETVERVRSKLVTADYFPLLGIRLAEGRPFDRAEALPGGPRAVIVRREFAERHLAGTPSRVGATIRLDGTDYTVVGVVDQDAGPLEARYDVFPVLQLGPPSRRGPFFLTVIGRMRASTDTAVAGSELRAINARIFPMWQAGYQDRTATWGLMGVSGWVTARVRPLLLTLLGTVALVLLIAVANAAGLLLARLSRQRREFAARVALGASRFRLHRLVWTDSLVLAAAGAGFGLLIASFTLGILRRLGPDYLPRAGELDAGAPVGTIVLLLSLGCTVLFALVPAFALRERRESLVSALREAGRSSAAGGSTRRARGLLVAFEFAIATPLLVGAALLLNSFVRMQRVDPGVPVDHLLTAALALPDSRYGQPAAARAFRDRLLDEIRAIPGVEAAATNDARPPRDFQGSNNFDLLDRPTAEGRSQPIAVWVTTSPAYFETMRIPLLAGRTFVEQDQPEEVVIVDREWADHYYPDGDAIGKRFVNGGCTGPGCTISTVIGVVDNVVYTGIDDEPAGGVHGTIYTPAGDARFAYLFVRTRGEPGTVLPQLRNVVHDLDPDLALYDVASGRDLVDAALATPRNLTRIVGAFAAAALLLALIGVYGVMAFFVQSNRREIGIRIALGGPPASVRRNVLARGLQPTIAGTLAGVALYHALSRFLAGLLFRVPARDPITFCVVALLLAASATLACWVPARSAARLDPARVLRDD